MQISTDAAVPDVRITFEPRGLPLRILELICLALLTLYAAVIPFRVPWHPMVFRALLATWVVTWVARGRMRNQHPVLLPLLLFFALAGLASIFSYVPLESWNRMNGFSVVILAVISADVIRTRQAVALLATVLLAAGGVAAARTGWQYVHGIGMRIAFNAHDPAIAASGLAPGDIIQQIQKEKTRSPSQWRHAMDRLPGNHEARWTLVVVRDFPPPIRRLLVHVDRKAFERLLDDPSTRLSRGRPDRAQGDFEHYIPYGGLLMVLASLAWGLLIAALIRRRSIAWLLLVLLAGLIAALLATETRSYLATLLLGFVATTWLVSGRRWRALAITAALAALSLSGVVIQRERGVGWLAMQDAGTQYRLVIWRDGLRLLPHHPLLGVGPDSVRGNPNMWNIEAYRRFPIKGHFHSTPIEIAVDCGLPALLVWAWLWIGYFRLSGALSRTLRGMDWILHGVALGTVCAGVALVASAFVQYNLGDPPVMMVVWLLLGMTIAINRLLFDPQFLERLRVW